MFSSPLIPGKTAQDACQPHETRWGAQVPKQRPDILRRAEDTSYVVPPKKVVDCSAHVALPPDDVRRHRGTRACVAGTRAWVLGYAWRGLSIWEAVECEYCSGCDWCCGRMTEFRRC